MYITQRHTSKKCHVQTKTNCRVSSKKSLLIFEMLEKTDSSPTFSDHFSLLVLEISSSFEISSSLAWKSDEACSGLKAHALDQVEKRDQETILLKKLVFKKPKFVFEFLDGAITLI